MVLFVGDVTSVAAGCHCAGRGFDPFYHFSQANLWRMDRQVAFGVTGLTRLPTDILILRVGLQSGCLVGQTGFDDGPVFRHPE